MVVAKRKEGRCAATELVELVLWCTELHQRPPMLAPTTRRTCTKQLDADILKKQKQHQSQEVGLDYREDHAADWLRVGKNSLSLTAIEVFGNQLLVGNHHRLQYTLHCN